MTVLPGGLPAPAPTAPPRPVELLPGVWRDLVGQHGPVATLRRAAAGEPHAMSHAWLITGPPGSGRSTAARAFAAALQCDRHGCGECQQCRTALSGAHPDVTLVRTEQLSIGVDEVRELVRRAAMSPTLGRRQVLVVEDADRLTERGADALLKSIEEPAAKTVWLLCAPTSDDVVPTIRSRCRLLTLSTPRPADVAALLHRRDGVDEALAAHAARAAQGHIGRARVLARDEGARNRRREVLQIPGQLTGLGACLTAAANLVEACAEEAAAATSALDAKERAALEEALGFGTRGARPRQAASALKELEEQQKARAKRFQRDALDRALTELTAWYRDVLALQTCQAREVAPELEGRPGPELVNAELRAEIAVAARRGSPESTLRRIDALLACRQALETNVAPLLAVEAMMIALVEG
ncbi:DNA polymerase III subunit delta' [Auraticoccus sp. F435]|uniref:DNA polymerase III subunit delta n=1 Tax=Auraticoccus cholistanensis TaxID=2656650 RepID=A0A6A9V179_9ACTN|nr:DNA polymerase III subunit delta' [Auraticoccus cholistanensis]MVA76949.1 DNA polymerase III subunit delta' [Auraticoccus cholistanensis]